MEGEGAEARRVGAFESRAGSGSAREGGMRGPSRTKET